LPRTQPVKKGGDGQSTSGFRPGTTVASFQWPAVCRTLLQHEHAQLDHVVRLLLGQARAGHSLIGVVGLVPRLGATTTALCLAMRAAGQGRRVVLAEANFRSPRIASLLEVVPTVGWEEMLRHSAPLADAAIHAIGENVDVLALGNKPVKDPQPLVSGLQAAVTAGVLRHAFDLVIVDLGTFFDPHSQPILLELISNMGVDAAVAVAGPEPADRRDVATIVEHLGRSGCELLGLIENRIAKAKAA
jgi:Mrp family chromosome partitioning ATPase